MPARNYVRNCESLRLLTVHRVHWSNNEQTPIDLQQLLIYMRRRLVCYSNSQSIVRVYKQLTKPVSDNSPEIGYCAVAYRYECFILSKINCCIKYSRKQNWRQRWHRFSGTPILSRASIQYVVTSQNSLKQNGPKKARTAPSVFQRHTLLKQQHIIHMHMVIMQL